MYAATAVHHKSQGTFHEKGTRNIALQFGVLCIRICHLKQEASKAFDFIIFRIPHGVFTDPFDDGWIR